MEHDPKRHRLGRESASQRQNHCSGSCVKSDATEGLVRQHRDAIVAAVNAATPGSFTEVAIPFES